MAVTNSAHSPQNLNVPRTWTVKTSGGDFTNFAQSISYFADKWLGALQTISIDAGLWAGSATISHPQASNISITGAAIYSKTMSSVQSSGSQVTDGNTKYRDIIINLNDITSITTNMFAIIHDTSGGTTPYYMNGCHQITNVDSGNSRITVRVYHYNVGVASGSVVGTVDIVPTVIQVGTGETGLAVGGGKTSIAKIVFFATGTADTATAISVKDKSGGIEYGDAMGIAGPFSTGIYLNGSLSGVGFDRAVSGCRTYGINCAPGSSGNANGWQLNGNRVGIYLASCTLNLNQTFAIGNVLDGFALTYGASNQGYVLKAYDNGRYGFSADSGSSGDINSGISSGNTTKDIVANNGSTVFAGGTTASSYQPTVNTVGTLGNLTSIITTAASL